MNSKYYYLIYIAIFFAISYLLNVVDLSMAFELIGRVSITIGTVYLLGFYITEKIGRK